jgi:hypothetical protein
VLRFGPKIALCPAILSGIHSGANESASEQARIPDVIAAEIVEDLQAALTQFAEIASDLKR